MPEHSVEEIFKYFTTMVCILFIIFLAMFITKLNQIGEFEQNVNYAIERNGGLNKEAKKEILAYSRDKYGMLSRNNKYVTADELSTNPGKYFNPATGAAKTGYEYIYNIKPVDPSKYKTVQYGTKVTYTIKAKIPFPVFSSAIWHQTQQGTATSLIRTSSKATDDNTTSSDNDNDNDNNSSNDNDDSNSGSDSSSDNNNSGNDSSDASSNSSSDNTTSTSGNAANSSGQASSNSSKNNGGDAFKTYTFSLIAYDGTVESKSHLIASAKNVSIKCYTKDPVTITAAARENNTTYGTFTVDHPDDLAKTYTYDLNEFSNDLIFRVQYDNNKSVIFDANPAS